MVIYRECWFVYEYVWISFNLAKATFRSRSNQTSRQHRQRSTWRLWCWAHLRLLKSCWQFPLPRFIFLDDLQHLPEDSHHRTVQSLRLLLPRHFASWIPRLILITHLLRTNYDLILLSIALTLDCGHQSSVNQIAALYTVRVHDLFTSKS
jgi:hypothetical protein